MATAKWATPSAEGSNIAGTVFNSLANGSGTAAITYDNSSNLDLYAGIKLELGSITPTAGGSISLYVFLSIGGEVEDAHFSGDRYTLALTAVTGAKRIIFPMVRLPPFSLRFVFINNSGVTLAASGNTLTVTPYNESVA